MKRNSTLIFAIILCTCLAGGTRTTTDRVPLVDLDRYVEQALETWHIPGVAIAIVKDDAVTLSKGYGVRELGKGARVDDNTLFGIGSCSKAFAAASLAILVDEGKVAWEDRVTKYLPWLQVYDPWVTQELRVRDLITHRVGTEYLEEVRLRPMALDQKDLLQRSRNVRPVAPFRERFVYSNNMFTAAGQVVTAVSGKPWPQFARERIWKVLNMDSTNASAETARLSDNHAVPHMMVDGSVRPVQWEYADAVAVPSGGVNSNARDMAQWLRFQLANGRYGTLQIISTNVFKEMHTPQTVVLAPHEGVTREVARDELRSHFFAYGMGWFVNEYRGRQMVWHRGSIDGFLCVVAMLPEERLGAAVMLNSDRPNLDLALIFHIFDAYLRVAGPDWSTKLLAETKTIETADQETERRLVASRLLHTNPSLDLPAYAGEYSDVAFGKATVSLVDGRLTLHVGALAGQLEHWHLDTFRTQFVWGTHPYERSFVSFSIDPSGNVSAMEVEKMATFSRATHPLQAFTDDVLPLVPGRACKIESCRQVAQRSPLGLIPIVQGGFEARWFGPRSGLLDKSSQVPRLERSGVYRVGWSRSNLENEPGVELMMRSGAPMVSEDNRDTK